ncbi:MAG: hypothetical protein HC923_08090 [Myxococcales bacterium]|nr:hypothetical protein [Myxococcales bacterium]
MAHKAVGAIADHPVDALAGAQAEPPVGNPHAAAAERSRRRDSPPGRTIAPGPSSDQDSRNQSGAADLELQLLASYGDAGIGAYRLRPRALITTDLTKLANPIPLRVHLNAGYLYDRSDDLRGDRDSFTLAEQFALGVTEFDQVVAKYWARGPRPYVTPYLEYGSAFRSRTWPPRASWSSRAGSSRNRARRGPRRGPRSRVSFLKS